MKEPEGWFHTETGGGCTAFIKQIPKQHTDVEWLITDDNDPSAPTDPNAKCCLSYSYNGSILLQWNCSCLAEALTIQAGANHLT
jgi:hypothetical protein